MFSSNFLNETFTLLFSVLYCTEGIRENWVCYPVWLTSQVENDEFHISFTIS